MNRRRPVARTSPLPASWEVQVCRLWLRLFARPRARVDPRVSSVGIKCLVDHWASKFTQRTVSLDAVLSAASAEGYELRRTSGRDDAFFEMSVQRWTSFEAREARARVR
jgi:hypothetical protein